MNGVHVGPLNPDRAESFGQVNGATSARQLIRHHLAMYPPDLARALNSARNEARSGDAIDRDEAIDAIRAGLEEDGIHDAVISGLAVRGEDDADQWLTYTWATKNDDGQIGRTSKGAMVYDDESFPSSIERGDEAVQIKKARDSGQPYLPLQLLQSLAAAGVLRGGDDDGSGPSAADLRKAEKGRADAEAERDAEKERADELEERIAALEASASAPDAPPTPTAADTSGGGEPSVDLTATEPIEGYDDMNADVVVAKLRDAPDDERGPLAERVLTYERANANRATVTKTAEGILDRTPSA